jgi:hypothetical protein
MGGACAVIMYQHSVHTGSILSILSRAPSSDPLTAAANAGPSAGYTAPSPATGVATPLGRFGDLAFPYTPEGFFQ